MPGIEKFAFLIQHSKKFQTAFALVLPQIKQMADIEQFAENYSTTTNITNDGHLTNTNSLVLCDIEFDTVFNIDLLRDPNNNIKTTPDKKQKYDAFCSLPKSLRDSIPANPGVYCWVFDNELVYLGETDNLKRRINHYSQVGISQSTNRKMNNAILNAIKDGKKVRLFFYETNHHEDVEFVLLNYCFKPRYNKL